MLSVTHLNIKLSRVPEHPPFRDYLEKLFGQVSSQNVKDVKVNRETTS